MSKLKSLQIYLLTLASALLFFGCVGPPLVVERKVPPVMVRFEKPQLRRVTDNFETAGELKAFQEALISAETSGQVEEILVREGDWVEKGDVLVKIKADDIRADLELAKRDYESFKQLEEEGAVSSQERLQMESKYKKLLANLDNREIKAVFSGTVGAIYIDLGDFMSQGSQILDLIKTYPLRVSFSVPEKLIPDLALGQKVQLEADSYPGKAIDAVIDFISPRVDPSTRTLLVRASVRSKQAYKYLKANQFVKVKQEIINRAQALMVREEAIYLDQGQQFLYVAIKDENAQEAEKAQLADDANQDEPYKEPMESYIAKRSAVETGVRKEGYIEIISGIEKDDQIIHAGLSMIYPGAKLINVTQ